MKSGISRRAFMKGAAAGTLGLAAASLFGGVPAAGAEAGAIPAEKAGDTDMTVEELTND